MSNNNPHSYATCEKISASNIGYKSKLGYRAPPEVLQHMSDGASRKGTQELGIDITNQIFQDLYPDAEFVEFAHRYDFILDGEKIDVKGSVFSMGRWAYSIQRNQITDRFFLMAFSEDYNLLRMWNIPAGDINHLTGIQISEGTFKRWEKYVVPIDF